MENKVITLINNVFDNDTKRRTNEILIKCPYCNHKKHKLSINTKTLQWHCWVCNKKGVGFKYLFIKVNAAQNYLIKANELKPDVKFNASNSLSKEFKLSLPLEFQPLITGSLRDPEFKNAAKYLRKRGLNKIDILRHNIGYCSSGPYKGFIIIPSYDAQGELNYFVGRTYYDSDFKHKNPKASKNVIGFDMLINWKEDINICEGAFDAIAIGENSIPLFGKFMLKQLKDKILKNKPERVNIILDKDASQAAVELSQQLISQNIPTYFIELPSDKDPNELGREKMREIIDNAEPLCLTKILEIKFGF